MHSSVAVVVADFLPQLGPAVPSMIGGIFVLLGVWVGNRLTLDTQLKQQAAAHAQARSDARQDRVRDAYVAVLRAALTYRQVVTEQSFRRGDETIEARNQRHAAALANLDETLATADLVLQLEDNDAEVLALFQDLRKAYTGYMVGRQLNTEQPGSIGQPELENEQRVMFEKLNALVVKMRVQLGSDVAPTPPAMPRRWWRLWS